MAMKAIIVFLLTFLISTTGFNIDVEHSVTFSGPDNSLFGYTSILQENRFLVAAPRANQTSSRDLVSPGAIYKCPISFQSRSGPVCDQFQIRTTDLPRYQNKQFLGSSMMKLTNGFVVCGHLSKYQFNPPTNFDNANGRCHTIATDLNNVNTNQPFPFSAVGMAGFSSAASKDGTYGVLGAPGFNDGRGGFVMTLPHYSTYMSNQGTITNAYVHQSYLGYSIAIGKFVPVNDCREPPVVIGMPRFTSAEGHVGSVVLVCVLRTTLQAVILKQLVGDQIGSGFGYSLATCDYDADGNDDLFVSAPFYETESTVTDGGRVYVFKGTGDNDFLAIMNDTLRADFVPRGRFGTAISCVGDVNSDNVQDIAVSAPYDGAGVVYIFNGQSGTINTMYSQKIEGQQVDSGLRSFGVHISQSVDVDGNSYPDFTVGSALSNKLTLLRARTVVVVTPLLRLRPKVIPLNSTGLNCSEPGSITPCTAAVVCFSFHSQNLGTLDAIDLTYEVRADVGRTSARRTSRVHTVYNAIVYRNVFRREALVIQKNQPTCETLFIRVTSADRPFFAALNEPLVLSLNYSLKDVSTSMNILPALNPVSVQKISESATFKTGCTGVCTPNLNINLSTKKSVIVYQQTTDLTIDVDVNNIGEPALAPTVTITSSPNVRFLTSRSVFDEGSVAVTCRIDADNVTINCELGNVLFNNQKAQFSLIFATTSNHLLPSGINLTDISPYVHVNGSVTVPSLTDSNSEDNTHSLMVPVQIQTTVHLTGKSLPDQAILSVSAPIITFEHTYEVYNDGPGPLVEAAIHIELPWNETISIDSDSVEVIGDGNFTDCLIGNETKSDVSLTAQDKATNNMMCRGPSAQCILIRCTVQGLDVNEFTSIQVTFDMDTTKSKKSEVFNYVSKGYVNPVKSDIPFVLLNNGTAETTSVLYPVDLSQSVEPVNLWVIVAASVGGFVLLAILIATMWKLKFFERKKKKQVDEYKRKSNYYEVRKTMRMEAARSKAMSKIMSRSDEVVLQES